MNVKLHRIDLSLPLPKYHTQGSFAFDLIAREDTTIAPQEMALIPGNIIVECPENLALLILPRSSTPRKKQLIFPHSIGLIDRDYCGPEDEIHIQVMNIGKEPVTVERGERMFEAMVNAWTEELGDGSSSRSRE